jgi:hypothetical protein
MPAVIAPRPGLSVAGALMALGWLAAWLTPTRGIYDLNLLPDLMAVAGVFAAALVAGLAAGPDGPRPWRVSWPALALAAVPALAAVLTLARGVLAHPEWLVAPLMAAAAGALTVLLADLAARHDRAAALDRLLARTLVAGALLTAWTVFAQARWVPALSGLVIMPPPEIAPFSNFYQRNLGALMMALGAAMLVAGARGARPAGQAARLLAWVALALAIALTASRAGAVLLVAGTVAARAGGPGSSLPRLIGAGVAAALLAWGAEQVVAAVSAHATASPSAARRLVEGEGLAMRLQIMAHGLRQWLDHPLLGGGWGSHPAWLLEHAAGLPWPRYSTHTHQLFTQLLGETGLAGVLPLLGVLLVWARRVIGARAWRAGPQAAGHGAVLLLLGLHSMVEFPLWHAGFLLPWFWSFARLWQIAAPGTTPRGEADAARPPVRLAMTAGALGLAASAGLAIFLLDRIDLRHEVVTARRADRPMPSIDGHTYFSDVLRYADPVTDSARARWRRELGERLARTSPQDWILTRLAIDQWLDGDPRAAEDTWVRACAMYRHRCDAILAELEALSARVPDLGPVRTRVLERLASRPAQDYDLRLFR